MRKNSLDVPDGFQRYWHDTDILPERFSTRHSVGVSIMIWRAISFQGKMELHFILARQNVADYISMLERASLLNKGAHRCENECIFQLAKLKSIMAAA